MERFAIECFIEEANRAHTTAEATCLFANAIKRFGYDRFCYVVVTEHTYSGLVAGLGIENSYPADWMQYYRANRYETKDPVIRQCAAANRPFTWDWLVKTVKLTPKQRTIMNEAEEAGLRDGVAIPICSHIGQYAGVGMASSTGGIKPDKDLLSKLTALVLQFHLVYTELEEKKSRGVDVASDFRLTDREKEILLWAAEGKSDFVIAKIIGVSHSTIRFHMNNIFKKLNTNERTLAAVKATRHGLILPAYLRDTYQG